mgnify:CR=1 FL=1
MPSLFEAYVTNLGKYNEGELVGETLKFPATTEEVQALLKRIGVDGIRYEEIFITSFDGDVLGLYDYLGEYENLDELNHLAHLLSDMGTADLEKFEAVIDSGEYTGSVQELINLTQNLDCFDFEPGISNDEELGRLYIQDYLKLHRPMLYNELILSGRLHTVVADLNEQAADRLDLIIRQMMKAEGVTEAMKAENQMLWVQSMNSIRCRAEEIIKTELIYC